MVSSFEATKQLSFTIIVVSVDVFLKIQRTVFDFGTQPKPTNNFGCYCVTVRFISFSITSFVTYSSFSIEIRTKLLDTSLQNKATLEEHGKLMRQQTSLLHGLSIGNKSSKPDVDSALPFQIPLESMESFNEAEKVLRSNEIRATVVNNKQTMFSCQTCQIVFLSVRSPGKCLNCLRHVIFVRQPQNCCDL